MRVRNPLRHVMPLLAIAVLASLLVAACSGGGDGNGEPDATGTAAPTVPPTATPVTVFDGEVVVYVVAPLSGEDAQRGQALGAGARLAAEEMNRTGGLMGNKIVVRAVNDFGDPEGALEAAQRVADSARVGDQVLGVIVYEGSDPGLESVTGVYLNDSSGLNPLVVVPASTELVPASVSDQRFFRLSAPGLTQASEVATVL